MNQPTDSDLSRFVDLRRWLRSLGCCWSCTITFAAATVESEAGRANPPSLAMCVKPENVPTCRERTVRNWADRPVRNNGTGVTKLKELS